MTHGFALSTCVASVTNSYKPDKAPHGLASLQVEASLVKIFFPQPPRRIDSFETEEALDAKKRFLEQVGKWLSVRKLCVSCLLNVSSILSCHWHSYRDRTCLLIGMGPASHRDGTPILVEGRLHSYRDGAFLVPIIHQQSHFLAELSLFSLLFHAVPVVLTFYFLSMFFLCNNVHANVSNDAQKKNKRQIYSKAFRKQDIAKIVR